MEQSKQQLVGLCSAAGFALLGFLLRLWLLTSGREADGLWRSGSAAALVLTLVSAAVLVVFILLSRRLRPGAGFSGGPASAPGYLAGGAALAAAGMVGAAAQSGAGRLICLLGLIAGVVVFWHGMDRARGKTPGLLTGCVVVIWLVARIIGDFKSWSTDPAVLDYCFQLFALLCSMLGCFHVAGFSAQRGKRRISAFWCMSGVYFCGVCLADGGLESCLIYGAFLLMLLQNTWCLFGAGQADTEPR